MANEELAIPAADYGEVGHIQTCVVERTAVVKMIRNSGQAALHPENKV